MKPLITFFIDFDNTLIDNDKVKKRLEDIISKKFGRRFTNRFLAINNKVRNQKGYVDFPSTIQKIAEEENKPELVKKLHDLFHKFNFNDCLFEKSTQVINYLKTFGKVVIVTEGDKHYQQIKIESAGIWNLVEKNVEIPQKDKVGHLPEIMVKYPSDQYYFIEDKPEILKKIRDLYKGKIKTIHVCQGHYSPFCQLGIFDITVKSLSELLSIEFK